MIHISPFTMTEEITNLVIESQNKLRDVGTNEEKFWCFSGRILN